MAGQVSPLAGKTIEPSMLVNVPRLVTAYFTAEHSGAHKQKTDRPDRVLVNHIGVHDEAHDVAYLFRLMGGHARKEHAHIFSGVPSIPAGKRAVRHDTFV